MPKPSFADAVTLHVFERPGTSADWEPKHLHHFAVEAHDVDEFANVRDRLLARGACDERVHDFGDNLSVLATDPDGGMVDLLTAAKHRTELPFAVETHG